MEKAGSRPARGMGIVANDQNKPLKEKRSSLIFLLFDPVSSFSGVYRVISGMLKQKFFSSFQKSFSSATVGTVFHIWLISSERLPTYGTVNNPVTRIH